MRDPPREPDAVVPLSRVGSVAARVVEEGGVRGGGVEEGEAVAGEGGVEGVAVEGAGRTERDELGTLGRGRGGGLD